VPRASPLRLRFENVPPEWQQRIPLFIEIRDEADRLHALRPGDSIGSFGGPASVDIDSTGHPLNPPPTPAPGKYVLSLRHKAWVDVAYLEIPIESPACGNAEVLVHIPDGARVVVSQANHLASRAGKLSGLAIGPAGEYLDLQDNVVLPRVPAGHHTIWKTSSWAIVRIGEVDVPASGDVAYVVDRELNANIEGKSEGACAVRLLRAADSVLVAEKRNGSPQIGFSPLAPGRYVLVVDERRIPIDLHAREVIDFRTACGR